MRVSDRQLSVITGRPMPLREAPRIDMGPILEKLKDIEVAVFSTPTPPPTREAEIIARIDRIEKALQAKPAWQFTVKRNAAGQIEKINATRKTGS
jgi:hypothetical protein